MPLFAQRLDVVRPSETKAITARAAELCDQGVDIITLSQGEPDFGTPTTISEAGMQAIRNGRTKCSPVAGVKRLHEAIRKTLGRDHGLDYDIDQITVGCGAKQLVFNALFASLDLGDDVVIPTPCWVSYPDMVALADGTPVLVACSEFHGFKLRPGALKAAINPRTKWLMLNSPCNPTGVVYSRGDLLALAVMRDGIPMSTCCPTTSMRSSHITVPSRSWPRSRRTSMSAR